MGMRVKGCGVKAWEDEGVGCEHGKIKGWGVNMRG